MPKDKPFTEDELELRKAERLIKEYDIRYRNENDLPEYMLRHKRAIEKINVSELKEINKYLFDNNN